MSSLPSKDGVSSLRALLRKQRHILTEIDVATKVAIRLESLRDEATAIQREIVKSLESMDCASSSNAGWERRIVWMLDELDKQGGS